MSNGSHDKVQACMLCVGMQEPAQKVDQIDGPNSLQFLTRSMLYPFGTSTGVSGLIALYFGYCFQQGTL